MTTPHISTLYTFPLKGARGKRVPEHTIDEHIGILSDRRLAIRKTASTSDAWAPKAAYRVAMNTPSMAAEVPQFAARTAPDDVTVSLADDYIEALTARLGLATDACVHDTRGHFNLCDTKGPYVSFLNLASVRALSVHMGRTIDPRRFRMNCWIEGLEPFVELSWVDSYPGTRVISCGDMSFRVDDACERCMAVQASPLSGTRDLDILGALDSLMRKRGYPGSPHRGSHMVMGILAAPLGSGTLRHGNIVRP